MGGSANRFTFFKQSGWMVAAAVIGGAFMYAVHIAAKQMPKAEYGLFTTLLQIVNLMGIPAIGLQTVFAQQTAAAITEEQKRQLAGTVRGVLRWTCFIWLATVVVVFLFQSQILVQLGIQNPVALWITVVLGLGALWQPIMQGLLQGNQDFLWLGLVSIFNGVGRFLTVGVVVLWLGGFAAGAMIGPMLGTGIGFVLAAIQTRALWSRTSSAFVWQGWLRRVIPLTLGSGAAIFMMAADMVVVRSVFAKEETGLYAAAGMIGRALVFFTIPLTAVMFPKIVRSAARAEKSDVMVQALGATALLGCGAAIGCTIFPELPIRIVYDKSFLPAARLVPWFAWCMLPLTLANVLINNLMARERFKIVPWLILIAAGYATTLGLFHESPLRVVQTLGLFSLLLLVVCTWFTWGVRVPTRTSALEAADLIPKI